jgi:hypothetical protein
MDEAELLEIEEELLQIEKEIVFVLTRQSELLEKKKLIEDRLSEKASFAEEAKQYGSNNSISSEEQIDWLHGDFPWKQNAIDLLKKKVSTIKISYFLEIMLIYCIVWARKFS